MPVAEYLQLYDTSLREFHESDITLDSCEDRTLYSLRDLGQTIEAARSVPDSESEDTESVFSMDSVASSVTSTGGATVSDETVHYVVNALFCTLKLSTVHAAAIQDIAIGPLKFERNIRRSISSYGKALKHEMDARDDHVAARNLQSRNVSERATRMIVERSRRIPPNTTSDLVDQRGTNVRFSNMPANQDQSFESDASEDEDEAIEDIGKEDFQILIDLLQNSQAYKQFKAQLLEFSHRPYEKRVLRSLECARTAEEGLIRDVIIALSRELSWMPTHLIQFYTSERLSVSNYLKACVEDNTGEICDWWPLQPRKHPLKAGYIRVKWQTVSAYTYRP